MSEKEPLTDEQRMRRISRRSFLWAGVAVIASYEAIQKINHSPDLAGTRKPFRWALEKNEAVWKNLFTHHPVPTYPVSARTPEPRTNGDDGLGDDFDPSTWSLFVGGIAGKKEPVEFTMKDIKALPRVEMTTELCCIEGWSIVVTWAGARFADFMAKHPPETRNGTKPDVKNHPEDLVRYVALATPDDGYYVGLDMPSALHPQTLLCYEMNGEPLALEHGAPLRLVIPVKYGIKNIKRIASIQYTDEQPRDFWAEQGYDWYAGL